MVNVGYNMKFENKNLTALRDLLSEDASKQTVFSEGPAPLTNEQKQQFAEAVKTFSQMGESVYSNGKLKSIVERISSIVETATQLVTEKEDMIDSVSAGRHMKHVSGALKEFQKSANEVMIHERRMESAFEDIAEGIQKYFEVG
tara:strand:+ start:1506 stop:1937 length:432 start_codon:yes stop_codon:yes gene_type:complete